MFSGDFPTRRCLRQFFPIIQFRVTSKLPRPLSLPFPKLSLVGTFLRIHAFFSSLPLCTYTAALSIIGQFVRRLPLESSI